MAEVTLCCDFGAPKNKVSHCFHCFPIYLPWSDRTRCHNFHFLNVEFLANFFTLLYHLHQESLRRHRCIEQSFGLCERGRGWDDLGEWHWNMYIIICEMNHQSRFDAWYRMLGAGALGWPRGMGWVGRWEGSSGWGTHVHVVDSCQCIAKPTQYCKVISIQ